MWLYLLFHSGIPEGLVCIHPKEEHGEYHDFCVNIFTILLQPSIET